MRLIRSDSSSDCTAPGCLDTRLWLSGVSEGCLSPGGSGLGWAGVGILLDQPLGVVAGDEAADGVADVIDGLVDAAADQWRHRALLPHLQGAGRARLGHEGEAR